VLCPHNCIINEGKFGLCNVRQNENGKLISDNYAQVSAIHSDPIEKKPLYHFYPGKDILSIGTVGCSFHCIFCQNYSISQYTDVHKEFVDKKQVYEILKRAGVKLLAFTYSEPLVWYEYILDVSKYLKEKDPEIKIVLVTNGYINLKPLSELIPFIDAANVDLKSFNEEFYEELCSGKAFPVKNFIKYVYDKIHLEVTTLVIPGYNDKEDEIENIAKFIAQLSDKIPYHISRYLPAYKLSVPPTDETMIERLVLKAKKHLKYVFSGNTYLGNQDTICPYCGNLLIKRMGYHIKIAGIKDKKCTKCGNFVDIVM